jgi:putative toxin-antitoxin system antitoxin component (TIGR02293 family)
MEHAEIARREPSSEASKQGSRKRLAAARPEVQDRARGLVSLAFEARRGVTKAHASRLFQRVAARSAQPLGKVRAELIPDSSWKRAGKTLGPQASQTAARLDHVLELAGRVWGNESDATEWLNNSHPELEGATPFSLLRTEAGGRAVEALLAALEFGFPV